MVKSSQYLSPNVLWSCNVCSFATAREKRDIYLPRFIAVASIKQLDDEIETNFNLVMYFQGLSFRGILTELSGSEFS